LLFFPVERHRDVFQTFNLVEAATNISNAVTSGNALPSNEKALKICHTQHHVPYTQSVIVFLYTAKLIPPLVQSVFVTWATFRLATRTRRESMFQLSGQKLNIISMPLWVKLFLFFTANLVRVLLVFFLFYMGAEYLMYAPNLNTLVTKAVGLVFIRTFSEVLSQGLTSLDEQNRMKLMFIAYDSKRDGDSTWWGQWGAIVVKLGLAVVISVSYCRFYHFNLQNFRDQCHDYHYTFELNNCPTCGTTFFGYRLSN